MLDDDIVRLGKSDGMPRNRNQRVAFNPPSGGMIGGAPVVSDNQRRGE